MPYDAENLLTQVLSDGINTYLYGNGRLAQYQAEMQYFGADGLGSVRQLYDATGQVLANNRYDPYGNAMSHSGDATSVFGYTGEQWDAATGLEYLRARYYSSAQGRFTTRDVWAGDPTSPMSYNGWSYADADPVNGTDPSGQCTGIAPWTDLLGAALSNPEVGVPSLNTMLGSSQAGAAALQKAAQNCAQNLSMASTRFQQGNYASSLAYASGLLTSLNEAQGLLAEVNRGDYGTKFLANYEQHDYGTAALYALRAPQVAQEGLAFWAQWFNDVETTTTWPEDLPGLIKYAEASCRLGGTGLTIASFLVPTAAGVKGAVTKAFGKGLPPGTVQVFRVEGLPNTRIIVNEVGEVTIQGRKTLYLNFGVRERAEELLARRIKQGMPGATIKSFEVPQSYLDELRATAVQQEFAKAYPERPYKVDVTRAPDQFALHAEQIEELILNIIQGTGRVGR